MPEYYLSLDAGTSGGKSVILNEHGYVCGFSKTSWSQYYIIPEDLEPYGSEFTPKQFWEMLMLTAKKAIKNAQISPKDIKAVSSTGQRHGCVFLDNHGKEVYAGPNRDARGLEIDIEEYMSNEEIYEITGHGLPFLFPLLRLLWFRENEEKIYDEINHILSIDGWVNFKLTGNFTIDDTAAAETLLFDIKKRKWSDKILTEFNIPYDILPERFQFGQVIGTLLPEVAQTLNLNKKIPVVMSASDTQASIIGCGGISTNTLGIVAGSSMPLQMMIDQPIIDPAQNLWTGAFANNLWVIESNAGSAGDIHKWFIDSILSPLNVENPYEKFEMLALSQPPGSRGVYANLGSQIFSSQSMLSVPNSGGFSFTPIAYSFDSPVDIAALSRSLFENLAYAARANSEQIQELVGHSYEEVFLVGGISRSKAFSQILANILNTEIKTFLPEGASVAGALASMIGTDKFRNLNQAVKIITDYSVFYPQPDQCEEYESLYLEWKEVYKKSREED
ncbi:MAG: FGGY-family carbohydrate kinase [Candidatus Hodarchaeales archaeon]|jgi:sugar (pentulose or hexulose) kinase